MTLTKDRVLVLLPPPSDTTPSGLIMAPSIPPAMTYGRVLQVGPNVHDVKFKDMVAFSPTAGDPTEFAGHAALILRESDIAAIVSPHDAQEPASV